MQQGSEGLEVDSTALSWSCSPWDGQATSWVAKLAPCHPQVRRVPMASLLPSPHWPQSHIPNDPPFTMNSCCSSAASPAPAALSRFIQNSTFPQSKCAFMSNFTLPSTTLGFFFDSVSAKRWENCISHHFHIKAFNTQRNPPSTPPFPSPDSRLFELLSWCYSYLTFIEYAICHARNFKKHLTLSVSNCNFPRFSPNLAQDHLETLHLSFQLNHKRQLDQ